MVSNVIQKKMTVKLDKGLDARPVAVFVQIASQYESKVSVEVDGKTINAKSIMGMMSLGLNTGEEVTVLVDGADEQEALENIEKYLSGEE